MAVRQAEFGLFVHVTGKTGFRVFVGIDNASFPATVVHVHASRTMAHFASLAFDLVTGNADARMRGKLEFFGLFFVAGFTSIRTHVFSSFDFSELHGSGKFFTSARGRAKKQPKRS